MADVVVEFTAQNNIKKMMMMLKYEEDGKKPAKTRQQNTKFYEQTDDNKHQIKCKRKWIKW